MAYSIRLDPTERKIWEVFHVHHGDTPPIMGYEGTRDDLARMFAELGFNEGAEIGVQRGAYSEMLLKYNPKLHLMCVDPWEPFTHHDQKWQDEQLDRAKSRISKYENAEIVRKSSIEASLDITNRTLDFVYIDAMHDFDNVMADILAWAPKVRKGGIVSGHDYEHYYNCGVPIAVDAYVKAHNVALYYITAKDPPRSWFFCKL
jgi:hypothetical protein